MQCGKVTELLEKQWIPAEACDWDNVGLLVGSREKEVKKIMLALDATDEVIDQAVAAQADLLITHHPMIFRGMKRITDGDFIGRRVMKLIRHDISYYAMHTNFDVYGMGDAAAERLGLISDGVLEYTGCREKEELGIDGIDSIKELGIGKKGHLPEQMTVKECAKLVKERFGLNSVRFFGESEKIVSYVAVSPGSGKSEIRTALEAGVDLLITGDIDHHDGIDAVAQGLPVIDAGHYGLEHIFGEYMKQYLEKQLPELTVVQAVEHEPFQVV